MDAKSGEIDLNPMSPETRETKLNILVVDDDPKIITIMPSMIEESSVAAQVGLIETAADGQKALEIIKKNPGKFNVVLTDGEMPNMDGLNLAKTIKESEKDIAVCLISAGVNGLNLHDSQTQESLKIDYGITAVLPKPFSIRQISDTLNKIKETREARNSAAK